MKRNNKGITLINFILLIFIIICSILIGFIVLKDDDISDMMISKEDIKRNEISKMNTTEARNEYLEFDSNITSVEPQRIEENEAKKYYYNQLNSIEKSIYNEIIKNIDLLKYGDKKINIDINSDEVGNCFQTAWDAFILDRPDIFWIDTLKISLITKTTSNFFGVVNYEYTLEPSENNNNYLVNGFETQEDVENAINIVETTIKSIADNAKGSTDNKVEYVHDELVNLIEYDQIGTDNNSNLYGALVEKTCVCEGYAEAFKAILDQLNIPCVTVYGDGTDSTGRREAHAWNYVKMDDGNWYAVDVTWDDPIIIGSGSVPGLNRKKYLLKGSQNFLDSHKEDGDVSNTGQSFVYPTLSLIDYK